MLQVDGSTWKRYEMSESFNYHEVVIWTYIFGKKEIDQEVSTRDLK